MRYVISLLLPALLFVEPLAANTGWSRAFGGAVVSRSFMSRITSKGSIGRRIYNPGKTRSMTRQQWKARDSEFRARESLQAMQREATRNWRKVPGNNSGRKFGLPHFYDRHGSQTTLRQQHARVEYRRTPDGFKMGYSQNSATRFSSARAQKEAIGKARIQMRGKSLKGKKYHEELVTSRHPFGEGFFRDSSGAIKPTGRLYKARVSFKYNPKTKSWDPWTSFPER